MRHCAGGWGQCVIVSFCYSLLLSLFLQFSLHLSCFLYSSVRSSRGCSPLGVSPLWCELSTVPQGSPCPGIGHLWPQSLGVVLAPAVVDHPALQSLRAISPPAQSVSSQECISSGVSNNASFHKSSPVPPTPNDYHPFLHAFEQRHHVLLWLIFWHVVGVFMSVPTHHSN